MINTIIIPVLNRYDLLERCVDSIPDAAEHVLIIDNGDTLSEEGYKRERVLRMPSNLGVATSWNLGIKAYPHEEGWLLLNSDAYFASSEDWHALDADASVDNIVLAGTPGWCCAWIGAEVVRRVGLFCERYYPAYMEDIDYEQRARRHGISIIKSDARVEHDNSSTVESNPALAVANQRTHAANRAYHQYRWANVEADGLPSDAEWSLSTRRLNEW
jgi:GT2 family glycosyltransferase